MYICVYYEGRVDLCVDTLNEHMSAYVSIRQHTSAYVSIRHHLSVDALNEGIGDEAGAKHEPVRAQLFRQEPFWVFDEHFLRGRELDVAVLPVEAPSKLL